MEIEQVIEEVLNNYNAYEKIIDVYYTDIYQYVLKQIGDVEVTKELCQDIFFETYRSLKRYDKKKASLEHGYTKLRIIVALIIYEVEPINIKLILSMKRSRL